MKKTSLVSVAVVATLAAIVPFLRGERLPPAQPPAHPTTAMASAEGNRLLGRLPNAFVPNLGQWEHPARYVARVGRMTMFLDAKGWWFTLVEGNAAQTQCDASAPALGVAVRMTFVGAGTADLVAEEPLPGRHNYFLGNDASKWRSDVPLYSAVRYREVHPGVDVRAREQDGHFEYDLLLQPGADLDPIEIGVEGIERMYVDHEGTLVMETRLGPVRMPAPLTWEEGPSGEKSPVACRYVLRCDNRFGFVAPGRRPGWSMVVDPGLVWSTFLGGSGGDESKTLALDSSGRVTIGGVTGSTNFPTTLGAWSTTLISNGQADIFITRLTPAGDALDYSTFVGGAGADWVMSLAVDAQGSTTLAGSTSSVNFPTTLTAYDTTFNGGTSPVDGFVTRLAPSGASLAFSTFLGGSADADAVRALAVDAQGATTVCGDTWSNDFPTTPGAFSTASNGGAFVSRLSPSGSSLVYSTFLGYGRANALAIDAQGVSTITGQTLDPTFPVTPGAFDTTYNDTNYGDVFVTRLTSTGSSLVYSTFLGGMRFDEARAIAVDAVGGAIVAGTTTSTNYPTTVGAFDTTHNGATYPDYDAFVTHLSPAGSSLLYSTFLGGSGPDEANALALDSLGRATVSGRADSTGFPTTPGAITVPNGTSAFVTRLSQDGARLVYSARILGGTAHALAVDTQDVTTIAGNAGSYSGSTYPTTPGAFAPTYNGGGGDAFITRLDMLPTGVSAFGNSSPGCTGPLAISVTSMPRVGNANFALTCGNAPPSTTGLLAFTINRFVTPWVVSGLEVWVDPALLSVSGSASSNSIGASNVPLSIPTNPALAGVRLFAQFFWAGPTSPAPCPATGFSASNALDFTIQP